MQTLQKIAKHTDVLIGIGLLLVIAMLLLPLPHWMIDIGLVVAIAMSVVTLLTSVNVTDPLQFSVFPSLLVITTLLRLALSIAATKAILGTGHAGGVIETFGNFVMGGDFVVGFVAFLVLVIVQFMVITNGAGRVSEVVARFTLDALPGKQMAIDADLGAGLIDEDMARERRRNVKREADFYGAMDGASKFVKGDAIAAIMIIGVNIVGGFVVGMMRGDGDALSIMKTYTLLSVGEGLTSQIPALLVSSASGLLVTRAGQDRSMGSEVAGQFIAQPKVFLVAGIAMLGLGLVPGFPLMVFFPIGGAFIAGYRWVTANPNAGKIFDAAKPEAPKKVEAPAPTGPEAVLPLLAVDPIEIEIGYGLTRLADPKSGGDLPDRISATRRQVALELGFVMPTVRIRDSITLEPHEYVLKMRGEEVGRATLSPGRFLAVDSGAALQSIPGEATKDPVFGLDALWIDPEYRETAERSGFTVIEPSAVVSTHLAELVKQYAPELLSRQDVQALIEQAKAQNEAAVNELIPNVVGIAEVQKVLQHLLRERVPIRDMTTILETIADFAPKTKDTDQLGEIVRSAISRTITRQHIDHENRLMCLTIDPALERQLGEAVGRSTIGTMITVDPETQANLIAEIRARYDEATGKGLQPILLCSSGIRLAMRRMLDRYLPNLPVVAYNEVAAKADVEFVGQIRVA